MNKKLKIATAAVAVVMAGTMAFGMFGCKKDKGGDTGSNTPNNPNTPDVDLTEIDYGALDQYTKIVGNQKVIDTSKLSAVELTTLVGYSGATTGISYNTSTLSGATKMLDGKTYENASSALKPAWVAAKDAIGIKGFKDLYDGVSTGNMLKSEGVTGTNMYQGMENPFGTVQMFTASTPAINEEGAKGKLLNLQEYIHLMPNFKHFLQNDENTYLSLVTDENGSFYTVPYFDGDDDIEKYELVNKGWVEAILDKDLPTTDGSFTFEAQATAKKDTQTKAKPCVGTSVSLESYIGKTGSYEIDTTKGNAVVKAKINYTAAYNNDDLIALVNTAAGAGADYKSENTSGNIVEMMNFVINKTQGKVKGSALVGILRKYIDVAYTLDGAAYTKRSDVFNSESACWDVDLLVALGRCAITYPSICPGANADNNGGYNFAIAPRNEKASRFADIAALAGELYGVRGLESKYCNLYINKDGGLETSRDNVDTYQALQNMHLMQQEGLICTDTSTIAENLVSYKSQEGKSTTLMMHDYVQTQTGSGGWTAMDITHNAGVPEGYNFAPVLTPVSKWDTDDNGSHETTMRFTESWRSVKNSGLAVSKAAVSDPAKLAACLALIDYLYSNDGMIVMSYGTQASGADKVDGFWYGNKVTSKTAQEVGETYDGTTYTVKKEYKKDYFIFKNEVYTGLSYQNKQNPMITDAFKELFQKGAYKNTEAGIDIALNDKGEAGQATSYVKIKNQQNYTNFARAIIGSTLSCVVKQQALEYQCTPDCGIDGAAIVDKCLNNGTIRHIDAFWNELDYTNKNWYSMVPTALPLSAEQAKKISDNTELYDQLFGTEKANKFFYWNIIEVGYGGSLGADFKVSGIEGETAVPANADACIAFLNKYKQADTQAILEEGWQINRLLKDILFG